MSSVVVTHSSLTMTGATIQISVGFNSARDRLSYTGDPTSPQGQITTTGFDPTTGTLQLSGTASPEDYTEALRSIS